MEKKVFYTIEQIFSPSLEFRIRVSKQQFATSKEISETSVTKSHKKEANIEVEDLGGVILKYNTPLTFVSKYSFCAQKYCIDSYLYKTTGPS